MMKEIPFAFQWIIPENQLMALKDSKNGFLQSEEISIISGAEYNFAIYPNGNNEQYRGQTWNFLQIGLGNLKKIEADYTVTVESANYSRKCFHVFATSKAWGNFNCGTKKFFNPDKKFIVDGKFIIKINGIFRCEDDDAVEEEKQIWDGGKLGDELWEKNDGKDFTIVVDEKELKVHKLVLRNRSTVFAEIFDKKNESKLEIIEFSFDVVETAIKLLYDCNFGTSLSLDDKMSLLQFFDKYNVSSLKDKIEPLLIEQISASSVCRLTNCSIYTNAKKLESKCMEFLMASFAAKTPLADIGILNKDIALKILQNSLYHVCVQPE